VTNRRNVVLSQMAKGKIITKRKKKLQSLPIKLNFKLETTKTERLRILENTCVIT
jgi:penicillin-binding protein 1A